MKKGTPCEETKRYVQNYIGVVDLRPVTDEDLVKHEDELYSDEELDPRIVDAATRRKTHVGGTSMEREDRRMNAVAEGEKEKSREAIARGDAVWGEGARGKKQKTKESGGCGVEIPGRKRPRGKRRGVRRWLREKEQRQRACAGGNMGLRIRG